MGWIQGWKGKGFPSGRKQRPHDLCMERTCRQGAAEEKSKIKQREMKRIVTSVLGMLAMMAMLRAQIDFGGTPPSFCQGGAKAVSSVPVQKVEHHLDEVSLMEEEAEARLLGLPPRIAMNVAVDYSPATAGIWRSLPDGKPVWQLGLELPGAKAILVSYADFYLPEGVELLTDPQAPVVHLTILKEEETPAPAAATPAEPESSSTKGKKDEDGNLTKNAEAKK